MTSAAVPKLLFLLPEAFRTEGGIQAYCRLLLRAVAPRTNEPASSQALLLKDRPSDIRDCAIPVAASSGNRTRFVSAAIKTVITSRPDVIVFGHLHYLPVALALRALRPEAAQVVIAYGVEAWRPVSAPSRLALRKAERILAVSQFTAASLAARNGLTLDNSGVLACAVEPERVTQWTPLLSGANGNGRPTLLTVSRLDAGDDYKGIDIVLQALPGLARGIPDLRYVVVGDGSDRARLQRLAVDLGIERRVEFRGQLSVEALGRAYAESSLFVLPSTGEGFGIVFAEAALFGKPSVAVASGGAPEVVVDGVTGCVVPPRDAVALGSAVRELLENPGRLAALGARARQRALEYYSFDAFAEALRRGVREALQARDGRSARARAAL